MIIYNISLIEIRVINSEGIPDVPDDLIHLFWSNKETSNLNAMSSVEFQLKLCCQLLKAQLKEWERIKLFKTSETQELAYEVTLKTTYKIYDFSKYKHVCSVKKQLKDDSVQLFLLRLTFRKSQVLCADVLYFVETWNCLSEQFEIPGFIPKTLRIYSTKTSKRNKII